jgi:hypothetical protein
MPVIRKATNDEVAGWSIEENQIAAQLEEALERFRQLPDRTGLTRMHYERSEAGWFARVYTRNQTIGRLFSDTIYGGPSPALTVAIAWRDATRAQFRRVHQPRRREPRIVRVDKLRMRGFYAYPAEQKRRYFADGAHGGQAGSERAARAWALQATDQEAQK